MDRISFSPKVFKKAEGLPSDNFLSLKFKRTTKPLIDYNITNIINQQEQFEKERIEVRSYRFSGKINIFTANELTQTEKVVNPDGSTTLFIGALDEDWDPLFDGEPALTPNNWLIQLLYPHKKIYDYNIISYHEDGGVGTTIESKAELGPQIKNLILSIPSGEEEKLGVVGVQKHNLQQNDFVYVYDNSTVSNPYTGIHQIISLGIDGENLDKNFTLDQEYTVTHNNPSNYRKMVGVTRDDINFSNPVEINTVTASDADGNTIGSFGPNDTIYTKIQTQTPHNIFSGSTTVDDLFQTQGYDKIVYPHIDLRGTGVLNGLFEVVSYINKFTFVIKLTYFTTKGQSQTFSLNKPKLRQLDCTPSEYYIRKFKVLTTNKYDVYKCAFSSSIYPKTLVNRYGTSNKTWLYHFNEDIDVSNLLDNNNKPVTEIYTAFIKRAGQNTYPWSNVVSGWDFNDRYIKISNGLETISSFNSGGVGIIEKPNEQFDYIGDYSEYNKIEIKEKTISKIVHRFGKASEPNGEGYYLEPFKKMEIMNFSGIIENSNIDEETEGIPDYAEVYPNGVISWRDFLPIGFLEPDTGVGVDYPFINGKHYFYSNNNLYIRRQSPPPETKINQDNVKISKIQEVC